MSLGEKYERGKMKMGKHSKEDRRKREDYGKIEVKKGEINGKGVKINSKLLHEGHYLRIPQYHVRKGRILFSDRYIDFWPRLLDFLIGIFQLGNVGGFDPETMK
jgi:hypothetical protein